MALPDFTTGWTTRPRATTSQFDARRTARQNEQKRRRAQLRMVEQQNSPSASNRLGIKIDQESLATRSSGRTVSPSFAPTPSPRFATSNRIRNGVFPFESEFDIRGNRLSLAVTDSPSSARGIYQLAYNKYWGGIEETGDIDRNQASTQADETLLQSAADRLVSVIRDEPKEGTDIDVGRAIFDTGPRLVVGRELAAILPIASAPIAGVIEVEKAAAKKLGTDVRPIHEFLQQGPRNVIKLAFKGGSLIGLTDPISDEVLGDFGELNIFREEAQQNVLEIKELPTDVQAIINTFGTPNPELPRGDPEQFKRDTEAKRIVEERLSEIGIGFQLIGAVVGDITNLIPFLGITNALDTIRFFRMISALSRGAKITGTSTRSIALLQSADNALRQVDTLTEPIAVPRLLNTSTGAIEPAVGAYHIDDIVRVTTDQADTSGIIKAIDPDTGKVAVLLPTGKVKKYNPDKLTPLDPTNVKFPRAVASGVLDATFSTELQKLTELGTARRGIENIFTEQRSADPKLLLIPENNPSPEVIDNFIAQAEKVVLDMKGFTSDSGRVVNTAPTQVLIEKMTLERAAYDQTSQLDKVRRSLQAATRSGDEVATQRANEELVEMTERFAGIRGKLISDREAAEAVLKRGAPGRMPGFTQDRTVGTTVMNTFEEHVRRAAIPDENMNFATWKNPETGIVERIPLDSSPNFFAVMTQKVPGLARMVSPLNRNLLLRQNRPGMLTIARNKAILEAAVRANMEATAMSVFKSPFKMDKGLIEEVTGMRFGELFEGWKSKGFRNQFANSPDLAAMDEFVGAYEGWRLSILEDAKSLGLNYPQAWEESEHFFRQMLASEDEVGDTLLHLGGAARKPGSFKDRHYTTMEDAYEHGKKYSDDMRLSWAENAYALRVFAIDEAFRREMSKVGWLPSKLMPVDTIIAKNEATQIRLWASKTRQFVRDASRGEPPKIALRSVNGVYPPKELEDMIVRATRLSRTGQRQSSEMKSLKGQADAALTASQDALRVARQEVESAKTAIIKRGKESPARFPEGKVLEGKDGKDFVRVSRAGAKTGFGDMLFDDVARKAVDDIFEPTKISGAITGPAQLAQTLLAAATSTDFGIWFIHMMGLLAEDTSNIIAPWNQKFLWGRAIFNSTGTFIKPSWGERHWAGIYGKNPSLVSSYTDNVGVMAQNNEVFQSLSTAGLAGKIPLLGPPIRAVTNRFGEGFGAGVNYAMFKFYEANLSLAKNEKEILELGTATRNTFGMFSSAGVGLGRRQRMFERSWIMFAPSFTRAVFAMILKAVTDPTSFGGRKAIRTMTGLLAAGAIMNTMTMAAREMTKNGGQYPWDLDWDELSQEFKDSMTPGSGAFMAVRVRGNYFGIGGPMRAGMNFIGGIMAGLATDPEQQLSDLNPIDPDKPFYIDPDSDFLNLARSKAPPMSGVPWTVATGEDFLGNKVDRPIDYYLAAQSAPEFGPFFISAAFNAEGSWIDKLGVGSAEFLGIRSYPVSVWTQAEEITEKETGIPFEQLETEYPEVLREAKDNPDDWPLSYAAWKRVEQVNLDKGVKWTEAGVLISTSREEVTEPAIRATAEQIKWFRPGGAGNFDIKHILGDQSGFARAVYQERDLNPDEARDDQSVQETLIDDYWAVKTSLGPNSEYSLGGNEIDWDRYYADLDAITDQINSANKELLLDPARSYDDPVVVEVIRRKARANEMLSLWFDMSKYRGATKAEDKEIDALIDRAKEIRITLGLQNVHKSIAEILRAQVDQGLIPRTTGLVAAAVRTKGLETIVLNPLREQLVMENPDLVVFQEWLFDTLDEDQQEEWMNTYRLNGLRGVDRDYSPLTPTGYNIGGDLPTRRVLINGQ